MNLDQELAEARCRFAHSLVGRWSTAQGSFDVMMGRHWEIRPDGTGHYTDTGPFEALRSETRFEWRHTEPFAFELRETEYIALDPDYAGPGAGDEPDDDSTDDEPWCTVRYDFRAITIEGVPRIVLVDSNQPDSDPAFFTSLAPLRYTGPIG